MAIFIRHVLTSVKLINNHHNKKLHLFILAVHLILLDHLSTGQAAVVDDGVHVGPCGELPLPVGDGGEGSNDQEGALDVCSVNLRQQRDRLDGLPQTHLICQDTVLPERQETEKLVKPWGEARTTMTPKRNKIFYIIYLTCVHLFYLSSV